MRRIFVFLFFIVVCLTHTACLRPLRLPDQDLLDSQRILAVVANQSASRERISGRFKLQATGIKQFFGHVDVIIALQKPSSFYLSIPSFFEIPARVITSDGSSLYLLDMSGTQPQYLVEPTNSRFLEEWLGLPIPPNEFVEALSGVANLASYTIIETDISRRRRRYSLTLKTGPETTKVIEFDADSDDLLSQSFFTNGNLSYSAKYSEFKNFEGTRFPSNIVVSVRAKDKVDLQISAIEISFPKDPFEDDVFQIEEP